MGDGAPQGCQGCQHCHTQKLATLTPILALLIGSERPHVARHQHSASPVLPAPVTGGRLRHPGYPLGIPNVRPGLGKRRGRRVRYKGDSLTAPPQEHDMVRSHAARRLALAAVALGMIGTAALAQPPKALDPIAEAKARQQIADQKAQAEVETAIKDAERIAKTNPARAVQTLKAAQTSL